MEVKAVRSRPANGTRESIILGDGQPLMNLKAQCQCEALLLPEAAANSSGKMVSHAHLQGFKHTRDEKKMKREK